MSRDATGDFEPIDIEAILNDPAYAEDAREESPEADARLDAAFMRAVSGVEGFEPDEDDLRAAAPDPIDPDADDDFRAEADDVIEALYERIGESAPEPRLEATRMAVEMLGDVHRAYPVIHITGTNGKSSTARIIESLLRAHGLRTGLLTSPHLERLTERICIDGRPIRDERLVENWRDTEPILQVVDAKLRADGKQRLTFFEALTVLACACFADAPVDVAVIEVGMGGEWDSTNVMDGQVAVFTPIDLDHQARLGSSIQEIARTKAGIIKPDARVVSAKQTPEALAELQRAADAASADVHVEGRDFEVASDERAVGGRLVSVRGLAGEYDDLFLPLHGEHQSQNAAVALAAVEAFFGSERELRHEIVQQGMGEASSPGRLQIMGRQPLMLIDAAHNPHGAAALARAVSDAFEFDRLVLVLGVLGDKDAEGIVRELAPLAEHIVATESDSPRAVPADELSEQMRDWTDVPVDAEPDLADALELARQLAVRTNDDGSAPNGAVLIAGSLTVIGAAAGIARDREWMRDE